MVRDYELTFIVRPDVGDDQVKAAAERVQALITSRGGVLTNIQQWGKRRLAYYIAHLREGSYFVYRFQMDAVRASELEHELNLDEQILRFLVVYLDRVALEALKNPPQPYQAQEHRRAPVAVAPAAEQVAAPARQQPAPAAEAEAATAAHAEASVPTAAAEAPTPAVEAEPVAEQASEATAPEPVQAVEVLAPGEGENSEAPEAVAAAEEAAPKPSRARKTAKAAAEPESTPAES